MAERRDASALLAGCHPRWRRQRPDNDLLTRADWQQLLPLVAAVHRHHPHLPLTAVLTDRVRSARHLPAVLAWRLQQLLRQSPPQPPPQQPPRRPAPHTYVTTVANTDDWRHHHDAVRTLGGPAAARAALAAAGSRPTR